MSQKNIVFITADQLAASYIGCYGSGVNSTPTLDALAAQGARFERCYSTSPSCAPTRATILTGRSPAIHGIISNNYALSTDIPTFAHVLQACGYRTGGFGKFHQTPMFLEEPETIDFLGFDESAVTEDPKWGPWLRWVKEMHPEHYETALSMCWTPGQRPLSEAQMAAWKKAQQEILLPIKQNSEWGQMYQSPLPSELHDTTYMTNLGLDFIKRHVEEYGDKPFFCHIS
jgi:arylsulfatase A-like enzyme